jgi:hypothetical protein
MSIKGDSRNLASTEFAKNGSSSSQFKSVSLFSEGDGPSKIHTSFQNQSQTQGTFLTEYQTAEIPVPANYRKPTSSVDNLKTAESESKQRITSRILASMPKLKLQPQLINQFRLTKQEMLKYNEDSNVQRSTI